MLGKKKSAFWLFFSIMQTVTNMCWVDLGQLADTHPAALLSLLLRRRFWSLSMEQTVQRSLYCLVVPKLYTVWKTPMQWQNRVTIKHHRYVYGQKPFPVCSLGDTTLSSALVIPLWTIQWLCIGNWAWSRVTSDNREGLTHFSRCCWFQNM